MLKTITKFSMLALLSAGVISCGSDDDSGYNVPSSYNYTNVSYSGQTSRIDMLKELTAYMKTADITTSVDATAMKNMFANNSYTWTSTPFTTTQPTKQLKNKAASGEAANIENWMDKLAFISTGLVEGSNGVAGIVTSGSKKYIFDENGFEPIQLIDKGIMGSVFYYQGTSVYLSDAKVGGANNTENAVGKDYTEMQHYWDESFGYGSFPIDINNENIGIKSTNGELSYYSKYLKKATDGGLQTATNLMINGFIKGRAAINNKKYNDRDAATKVVRAEWEMINVAAALHYLNQSILNISDDALRMHELSEAYAFINALKFNSESKMTPSEVEATLNALGDNFYTITATQINAAKTLLATKYGVDASNF